MFNTRTRLNIVTFVHWIFSLHWLGKSSFLFVMVTMLVSVEPMKWTVMHVVKHIHDWEYLAINNYSCSVHLTEHLILLSHWLSFGCIISLLQYLYVRKCMFEKNMTSVSVKVQSQNSCYRCFCQKTLITVSTEIGIVY